MNVSTPIIMPRRRKARAPVWTNWHKERLALAEEHRAFIARKVLTNLLYLPLFERCELMVDKYGRCPVKAARAVSKMMEMGVRYD